MIRRQIEVLDQLIHDQQITLNRRSQDDMELATSLMNLGILGATMMPNVFYLRSRTKAQALMTSLEGKCC